MNDLRKAAQALVDRWDTPLWKDAQHTGVFIDALRVALSQHEEPVAWINEHGHIDRGLDAILDPTGWTPLYAAPPQRKPLTNEAMQKLMDEEALWQFARAIERSHGIGENK